MNLNKYHYDYIVTHAVQQWKRNPHTYVNSWVSAPEECWDYIRTELIPNLEHTPSGKKMKRERVARLLFFYGHVLGATLVKSNIDRYDQERGIPLPRNFLREQFGIRISSTIETAGTGIACVQEYCPPIFGQVGQCNQYWPTDDLLGLFHKTDSEIPIREYLKKLDIETSKFRFPSSRIKVTQPALSKKWKKIMAKKEIVSESIGDHPTWYDIYNTAISGQDNSTSDSNRLISLDLDGCFSDLNNLRPSRQKKLIGPLKHINNNSIDGKYLSVYNSYSSHCGRYFEIGGGIQGLQKDLRKVLLKPAQDKDEIFNYDIVKCQARGLCLLFDHHGFEGGKKLVLHLIEEFNTICNNLGVDPDFMKKALYAPVWRGTLNLYKDGQETLSNVADAFIDKYGQVDGKQKLKQVRELLKPVCQSITAIGKIIQVPVGAFLTVLEQEYIHTLTVLLETHGIVVLSLQHDGLITNQPIPQEFMDLAAKLSGFTNAAMTLKPL
jgi:hypothetical protein